MSVGERIPIFAIIWAATVLATLFLLGGEPISAMTVPIVAIIFGVALISTALATRGMGGVSRAEVRRIVENVLKEHELVVDAKAKRTTNPKLDALVKSLSPDELADLRARLEADAPPDPDEIAIGDDGELIRRSGR